MKTLTKNRNLITGMILLLLVLIPAVIGMFWTPYDADAMNGALKNVAPSFLHPFGTDNFGRDILSRIMEGAGTTFIVGVCTVLIGAVFGTIIGAITGYYGGIVDEILMRLNDGLASFPSVLLALIVVSIAGTGKYNIIIALGIVFIPSFARVIRSEVITKKELDYVTNARLMGAGDLRIIFLHILPNTRGILLATITIALNNAVLAEAGLSYLSLGVQPPDASLGRMLSEAQSYLLNAPWYALIPGITIVLTVLGVGFISQGLEDNGLAPVNTKKMLLSLKPEFTSEIQGTSDKEDIDEKNASVKNILDVRNLEMGFFEEGGFNKVLKCISFDVEYGEILGIVGESGSGKSMTAFSIMNLLPEQAVKTKGSIVFDGIALDEIAPEERRKITGSDMTMIFQEPMSSLNPVYTIGEQINEMLLIHYGKTDKQRVYDALEETGLENVQELYDKYPYELSGGMRQRVMIAMAMICRPKLLIADEPTTALDVTLQMKILKLLKKLNEKYGTTIILISHDLSVINSICTRAMVMENGIIVEEGITNELLKSPKKEYTKQLISAAKKEFVKKKHEFDPEQKPLIKAENLNIFYKTDGKHFFSRKQLQQVGKNLNFSVMPGEIFGIVGESGSGKSSLVKTLAGLGDKHEGTIEMPAGDRPQMVFQDPYGSLNPSMKVGRILEEPLRIAGGYSKEERKKKVGNMLLKVDLPQEFITRRVSELSGGQRQRVAIALALILKMNIIILDEPVSALDVTIQAQILELLVRLRDEYGITYLFVSHDIGLVRRVCDRVCVMLDGEIVESGNAEEVFSAPKHEYTKELVAAAGL